MGERHHQLKKLDSQHLASRGVSQLEFEATQTYYEQAKLVLRIWELHCEGISEREISQEVKSYKKSTIHNIVAHIASLIRRS